MNNVAVVVHTCDRYKLLYPGFEYFFKKHWPYQHLEIAYYFLTEEVDYPSDIFINIKTGKGEWTDRLSRGLQQIPEPYLIYMQEDMWLNKDLDADTLEKVIKHALTHQINLLKLSSNAVYVTKTLQHTINGLNIGLLDNSRSKYLMSHQMSLWSKSFLLEQLQYQEHPWRNERKGTKRLKKLNPKIYQIDLFSENGSATVNHNDNLSTRSAYFTVSKNAVLNYYAKPFINEMSNDADPQIKNYATLLARHMKENLTHDGLPQPRKDDIIKKIKNYFKQLRS